MNLINHEKNIFCTWIFFPTPFYHSLGCIKDAEKKNVSHCGIPIDILLLTLYLTGKGNALNQG